MTLALTAADRKKLDAIAAKGFRVVVEGNGVRVTVEPLDGMPEPVQASGGGARSAWDDWAAKKGAP